jgi:hypothetical protein
VPPHLVQLVSRVERLAQERRAQLLRPEELGTVEREGLLLWVEVEESYRRAGLRAERELHAILTAKAEAGL